MFKSKFFFAIALASLCSLSATAQSYAEEEAYELGYKPQPYGFVQLQGGVGTTFSNIDNFGSFLSPTASVGVGAMFSNAVGARIHVNAWESKGGLHFGSNLSTYKFNYVNTNLDVMLNLVNLFRKSNNNLVNVFLIGGVGLNYAWNNDDFTNLTKTAIPNEDINNAWGKGTSRKSLLGHNIRAGVLVDFNVHKHWNVGIEIDANSLDDRFNSKFKNSDDWMLTAQLSVTYKFGHKKVTRPAPKPVAPVAPAHDETLVAGAATAKSAVQDEAIKEVIFFQIREVDTADNYQDVLNRVAQWCKKFPNKTVTIDGYADKGTGNEKVNNEYAEQRATKFAAALQAKGIPASQMIIGHHGHNIQPYEENDKNRCVVIVGK